MKEHGTAALEPLPHDDRVRRGDSRWRIARRHRVRVEQITRWNRISKRKTLRPGRSWW